MKLTEYIKAKALLGGGGGDTPTGEISITANGTYNVSSYASADVAVPGPSGTTTLTYDANGTYTEDVSDYASAEITVNVSGGGGGSIAPNDVNFYDYDGTLLYSYSASDFANLTSMPENPDRTDEGLTAQGWNWSLADAKNTVAEFGYLVVGQMYKPSDNKTHLFIRVPDANTAIRLRFGTAAIGNISVDWGDGSNPETNPSTSATQEMEHTYNLEGDYEIKITENGLYSLRGVNNPARSCVYRVSDNWTGLIVKAYLTDISLNRYSSSNVGLAFQYCFNLRSIAMPPNAIKNNADTNYLFYNTHRLKCLIVPNGETGLGQSFLASSGVTTVSLPKEYTLTTSTTGNIFGNAHRLQVINPLSKTVNSICTYCYSLFKAAFVEGITTISQSSFSQDNALSEVVIPSSVTKLEANAFANCNDVNEFYIKPITPPTLENAALTPRTDCIIYVPAESLEAYQTATNWSAYASKMQGE